LYSLHNASFCGVYFYASRKVDPLFAGLTKLIERESLPIHRGEPEVPYVKAYADGMYPLFGVKETYDYLEKHTQEDPARHITSGASSHEYLMRVSPGALSLVSELPYITDPALDDHRPTAISRRDAMSEGLRRTEETLKDVEAHMRALALDPGDPRWADDRILRAVSDWLARTPKRIAMQKQALLSTAYSGKATRAQAFDAMVCKSFQAVLVLGETHRLAAAAGDQARAEEIRGRVEARIARIEEESHLVVLDLARLVRVQASALFLAIESL
jgi:hypothetical protein